MNKGSYNLKENLPFDSIINAAQILNSLDNLKKEIRLKFKRLTEQEFLVFSTIYQLSEEKGNTDYKNLSEKLSLTESSIRDYIGRLIKKGIPVEKTKINNKTIHLSISPNLKKIASLPTILQLRAI
jgi:DNA-binding MarR family transcriptional regulator